MSSKTKGEGEKLTRPVSFRLTAADHAAYLAKVEASGLKPSEFFRECVLQNRTQIVARQTVSKDWGRLAYLFNKASNNINQLAHRANADHLAGITTEETYTRILAELPDGSADECAEKLLPFCRHLLITGGHGDEAEVHNRLYVRGGDCHTFTCARLPGSYHGSGCTLASTLAGRLALGEEMVSAVRSALDYTWRTLRDAEQPGHGQFVPRRLPLDFCS